MKNEGTKKRTTIRQAMREMVVGTAADLATLNGNHIDDASRSLLNMVKLGLVKVTGKTAGTHVGHGEIVGKGETQFAWIGS